VRNDWDGDEKLTYLRPNKIKGKGKGKANKTRLEKEKKQKEDEDLIRKN